MILLKVIKVKNARFVTIGFFNHGFKFQGYVCNDCHDLTMLCLNISDIAIITVKHDDYRCIKFKFIQDIFLTYFGYHYKRFSIMKSLNINVGTVMKNPEMLEFVPDHLKTKKM